MDDTGDFVVVWTSEVGTTQQLDVFMQRFDMRSDDAGARVINTFDATTVPDLVVEGENLTTEVTQFVVTFSEDLISTLTTTNPG